MEQNSTPEFRAELLSTPTVNLIPITVGLITLLFQQVLKIEYNGSNPPQFIFSNNFFAFFSTCDQVMLYYVIFVLLNQQR